MTEPESPLPSALELSAVRRPLPSIRGFEVESPTGETMRYTLARHRDGGTP